MNEIKDNFIGEGLSVEDILVPHEKPTKFVDIPADIIEDVNLYMSIVLKKAVRQKNVSILIVINNAKNMFRGGVRYNDNLWMQHVAASIREIICLVDVRSCFHLAYKCIPPYEANPVIKEKIDKISYIKSYLSDVVHFVI